MNSSWVYSHYFRVMLGIEEFCVDLKIKNQTLKNKEITHFLVKSEFLLRARIKRVQLLKTFVNHNTQTLKKRSLAFLFFIFLGKYSRVSITRINVALAHV